MTNGSVRQSDSHVCTDSHAVLLSMIAIQRARSALAPFPRAVNASELHDREKENRPKGARKNVAELGIASSGVIRVVDLEQETYDVST